MVASELHALRHISSNGSTQSIRRRANLLLHLDEGMTAAHVAKVVGLSVTRVLYWQRQFKKIGMSIFPEGDLATIPEMSAEDESASELTTETKESISSGNKPTDDETKTGGKSTVKKKKKKAGKKAKSKVNDSVESIKLKKKAKKKAKARVAKDKADHLIIKKMKKKEKKKLEKKSGKKKSDKK